jgi:hypothetical protein
MEKVTKEKELKVIVENKTGILAEVIDLIAQKGVNIENICAYKTEDKAIFYILTDDNTKARKALEEKRYLIEEREVIVLRLWNRPGALSEVATKFRQNGINLYSVYGTRGGEKTTIVFSAEDNDKASEVFDTMIAENTEISS